MSYLKFIIPNIIKKKIKYIIISNKYGVKLSKDVIISADTQFEGCSVINEKCKLIGSYIGLGSFVAEKTQLNRVKVGRYCSIGSNVQTRIGLHPSQKYVSTHPAFFSVQKQAGFSFVKTQCFEEHKYVDEEKKFFVEIGNDVWIGNDVRIMDGVKIGDGAIIGLGSIVTKDIEPYSINVGIPAKKIGYRFNEKQVDFLLKFKWWDRDYDWLSRKSHLFSDIEKFQMLFETSFL